MNREPTVAEIAALTARLRELSNAGAAADARDRAQFLADKDALIERIIASDRTPEHAVWSGDEWADYRTYSPFEAAAELVARGVPPDQAPAVVERYLDGLSWERGWSPQDQWEIDDDDLAVMLAPPADEAVPTDTELDDMRERVESARAEGRFWQPAGARAQWREREEPDTDERRWELRDVTGEPSVVADAYGSVYDTGYDSWQRHNDPSARLGLTGAEGPPLGVGPALTAEAAAQDLTADGRSLDEARALVRGYLDDVSAQVGAPVDLWGLDTADLAEIRASQDPEAERRTQLARWHSDDQAQESVDEHVLEDGP